MWVILLVASAVVIFWREMIKLAVIGTVVLTTVGAVEIIRVLH